MTNYYLLTGMIVDNFPLGYNDKKLKEVFMKKSVILLSLSALASLPVTATELISSTNLKINSADGLTNLENVEAKLTVFCKYKSGILFPENKSCGSKTIDLNVEQDGTIKIPAIEKFSGIHGLKKSNYDVSVSLYEGKSWLTVISAYGEKVDNFKFDGQTLQIYKIKPSMIDVVKDGASIFGSELTNDLNSSMALYLSTGRENDFSKPLITSSMISSSLWSKENRNLYAGKVALKDEKAINLNELIYASFKPVGSETVTLDLIFSKYENYTYKKLYSAKMELKLRPEMLDEVKAIEIK